MSTPELVFLSVVLLVGVPASFFNRTALALRFGANARSGMLSCSRSSR
jgi:hypothetical protein